MKLKKPTFKTERKKETPQSEGAVFDLTGGSSPAAPAGDSYGASAPEEKKSRIKSFALKKKAGKKDKSAGSADADTGAAFGIINNDDDAFEVRVRNSEPLIKRLDEGKPVAFWKKDLQINLAAAGIILTLFGLLVTSAYEPILTLYALPGAVVFLVVAGLENVDKERLKWYVALGVFVLLVVALIILRKYIANGWALVMNQLYDEAEMSQAYIYDRFSVGTTGEDHPYRSMHIAIAWGSILVGLITALPPARFRRPVAFLLAVFAMIAFAYYGIIPSWICIAALAAMLIFVLSDGSILSSLAMFLVAVIVFGLILLIDPGENYSISRADEQFRDRFAFKSAYLQRDDELTEYDSLEDDSQSGQENNPEGTGAEFLKEHKLLTVLLIVVLVLAAIAAAVWMFMRRIRKRQAENRKGIDSKDPREAIIAMFPYAVRWLQPAGIDPAGKPFNELIPMIKADVSQHYAERYTGMYELWKEAAYSDHDMNEDRRMEMDAFLKDTVSMIKEKCDLKTRLLNTVKYAL